MLVHTTWRYEPKTYRLFCYELALTLMKIRWHIFKVFSKWFTCVKDWFFTFGRWAASFVRRKKRRSSNSKYSSNLPSNSPWSLWWVTRWGTRFCKGIEMRIHHMCDIMLEYVPNLSADPSWWGTTRLSVKSIQCHENLRENNLLHSFYHVYYDFHLLTYQYKLRKN